MQPRDEPKTRILGSKLWKWQRLGDMQDIIMKLMTWCRVGKPMARMSTMACAQIILDSRLNETYLCRRVHALDPEETC